MRAWLVVALLLASLPVQAACRDTTESLSAMAYRELVMIGPGGRSVTLAVRVADDPHERSAGFQHICPEVVENTNIYFEFDRVRRPSFHMRNVWAPLDIAFIDPNGVVMDIQRMEPYVRGATEETYYSPPGKVAGALETRAGYFAAQEITAGDWKIERLQ